MFAIVDVQYATDSALAACVVAELWSAAAPSDQWVTHVAPIAAYEPGAFYKRELPCLLAVLERAPALECVVIDGYVFLDAHGSKGLGAHLHEALRVPVIGLAKTAYQGSPMATPVLRGESLKPLFMTCVGLSHEAALEKVRQLHGAWRIPTLVKAVDALARGL